MRWLIPMFLMLAVSAARFDDYCNRSGGESCMNSPDCPYCDVSMSVNTTYSGTYALIMVDMKSNEPEELPLILNVRKDDDDIYTKAIDLPAFGTEGRDVRVEREPENATVVVELRDRDIGTAWAYEGFTLPGLATKGRPEILIPILGVVIFFGIIFFGFKQVMKRGPYMIQPIFAPFYPPEPPPEEEVIVVPKKKKYYYKKN